MKIRLRFAVIDMIRPDGSYTSHLSVLAGGHLPDQTYEVRSIDDLDDLVEKYAAQARATGYCGRVFAHHRGGRTVNGFTRHPATSGGVLVNGAVGRAAGADA